MAVRRLWLYLIIAAFCTACFAGEASAQTGGLKVAFVDAGRVFDSYKKKDRLEAQLKSQGEAKKAELGRAEKELEQRKLALPVLSDEAREKEVVDLKMRAVEVNQMRRTTLKELDEARSEMIKELLEDISAVIKEHAEQNGYDLILNDRILLYGKPELDITDEIVTLVNR